MNYTKSEKLQMIIKKVLEESEIKHDFLVVYDFCDNHSIEATEEAVKEAIEDCQEAYIGNYNRVQDYAEEYVEETGLLDSMPDNLRFYFDYEKFAQDMILNGDIWISENGNLFRNY